MAEAGGSKRWLKYGCFGCLSVLALVIIGAATLSGVAYLKARAEQIEERVLTPDLPSPAAGTSIGTTDEPGSPDSTPIGSGPVAAGEVHLDLRQAEFRIEPGPPGEPLRVDATYDKNFYALEESFETRDDGTWSYRVGFRLTGSGLLAALKEMFGGTPAKVRVLLPPDIPIDLHLEAQDGAAEAELGGLWLTNVELDLTQGGYQVDFSEPLREPVERMTLRASMGGLEIGGIGNASPRFLSVDSSMGGMFLGLRGEWVRDAEIEISNRMGGVVVRLPRDVVIEGLDRGGVSIAPEQEIKLPTLRFDTSTEMGDLEFID